MTTRSEDIWMCTECCTLQGRHDQWFTGDICEKCNEKMENNIPTAEELALQMQDTLSYDDLINPYKFASLVSKEFAKLHVEAALKKASEDAEINDYDEHKQYSPHINEKTILNAYPLTNIK